MTPAERMSMARRSLADVRTCLQTNLRCTSLVLHRYPPEGSMWGISFHENDVQMPLEKIKVHAAFDLLLLHMAGSSLMRYSSRPLLVGNIDLCLPMSLLSFNNYVMGWERGEHML